MGILLKALPWLKRFGPWVVVLLVAVGIYAAATMLVRDWKASIHDQAFAQGEQKERDRQDAIARRVEAVLTPRLQAIDDKAGARLEQQTKKETVYVDRIKTQIKTDPRYSACAVDDGVLRDRNEIRRSLETPASSQAGSGAVTATNPSS